MAEGESKPVADGLAGKKQSSSLSLSEKKDVDSDLAKGDGVRALDADVVYPEGARLAAVVLALTLSVFLMALDNTIIAVAIPKITDQFNALEDIGWYGSSYFLTTCAFQLFFGKLYTFYSIKYVYLGAIGMFELGSLVCGAAPSSIALIIGRAIAGVGAAGIFSGALIIVAYSVPLVKRPLYNGVFGSMYGVASVVGPLMGGAFTDHATWRWCFYINLPIGAITVVIIALTFKSPKRRSEVATSSMDRFKQFDPYGTAALVPAVICLLLALQWGGSKYEWSSGRIIALLVLFGIFAIAFIAIQFWKQENATVPPRIASERSVGSAAFFSFCIGGSFFVMIYYLPLWFQTVKADSATQSGIHSLPLLLGVVVMSIMAGIGTTVIGYYTPFMILAAVLTSIGSGLLTTLKVDSSTGPWIGYQLLFGLGIGAGLQLPLIAVQAVLPIEDIPIGTSLVTFTQILGGTIFISVAQNIFTNRLVSELVARIPNIDPQVVLRMGATNLKNTVSGANLLAVLEAYNQALTQAFYVSVAMAVLSIIGALGTRWVSIKGKKVESTVI